MIKIIKKIKDYFFPKKLDSFQMIKLVEKDKETLKIIDKHLDARIELEIKKRILNERLKEVKK